MLELAWHLTEESDSQVDRSQADIDVFEAAVYVARPIPCPRIVMLADPVAARFVARPTLKETAWVDSAEDNEPIRTPTVRAIFWLDLAPCPAWHRIDVSDSHVDRSLAVCPAAPTAV